MAIDVRGVREAFRKHLLNTSAVPPVTEAILADTDGRFSWQNQKFEPPIDNLWFRETFMWGEESRAATNLLEKVSVVQYDVMSPLNTGTETSEDIAKKIADRFRPGTSIPGGMQIAVVRSTVRSGSESPLGNQTFYMVPVQISFRAYAPNNE